MNDLARVAQRADPRRRSLLHCGIVVVIVLLIAGGGAVLWRAIAEARQSVNETLCRANLFKIHTALIEYQEQHHELPTDQSLDEPGQPVRSWRTRILPYLDGWDIDAASIAQQYCDDEPWNSQHNSGLVSPVARSRFACPCGHEDGTLRTSYVAVVGPGTPWSIGRRIDWDGKRPECADKILVIEVAESDIVWPEPRDLTRDEVLAMFQSRSHVGNSGRHQGRIHCILMDGRVAVLPADTTLEELRRRLTIDE